MSDTQLRWWEPEKRSTSTVLVYCKAVQCKAWSLQKYGMHPSRWQVSRQKMVWNRAMQDNIVESWCGLIYMHPDLLDEQAQICLLMFCNGFTVASPVTVTFSRLAQLLMVWTPSHPKIWLSQGGYKEK
ncbi:predicted protein [Coccidioides posadasii str. Silveira]|uniref:Predicted protein n=1 Tax=Coccidioides posadasii (strain RMSCC 757 / Silveira) TaxID=443226 RepID=E9DDU2_COCPS|nr:predicted protein [Coccidioides posadasii str. Silveira]